MVTDMVRLAWEEAYDVGVVVSSDSDFVPAVELLDSRGLKIVQAGFPPFGAHLATSCWASFDIFPNEGEVPQAMNFEFLATLATVVIAAVAVGGLVLRLHGQVSDLGRRVARIEGLLEGYFMRDRTETDTPPTQR